MERNQMTNKRLGGLLARFRKDEDGAMIIFSLFLFVLILWFGGMAVDYMRFETTRAKLQGTLDRAVLAAADLDQELPADEVVRDYFLKSDMLQFLDGDPIVDEGINYRVVTANAKADMPMFFADLPRVFMQPFSPQLSTLTVSGSSTAEERVSDVEVSLILDVSGSMSGRRFNNLVPAAHEFIDTVMANNTNAPQGLITMSIMAYSAVVNVGPKVAQHINLSPVHVYSTCPRFEDDLFDTTALDLSETYDRIAHFDAAWSGSTNKNVHPIMRPWCPMGDDNGMIVHSSNPGDLRDMVSDLTTFGNTAIDMGMKWGVALLDPSTRGIVNGLIASGDVAAIASGRPYDYGLSDVLKVAVLMTDGQNTTQYDLAEPYKSGISPLWFWKEYDTQALYNVPEDRISYQYEGMDTPFNRWDDEFLHYDTHWRDRWQDYPKGFNSRWQYVNATPVNANPNHGSALEFADDLHQVFWSELFANWIHNDVNNSLLQEARQHGAIDWNTYNAPDHADISIVNSWSADRRLSDICAEARTAGIIIYTVAFEAPSGGRTALQDCASSITRYFDVSGTDISSAFSAIASDIRALKLTQ